MSVLVTGGTGYIGSHTVVELIEAGQDVIIVDNLSNSKRNVISKIERITGKKPQFYEGDICDKTILEEIFNSHKISSVIHFAGFKAVGESVEKPLTYYDNNVNGTITLLKVMKDNNCKKLVFSSSATVYGMSEDVPFNEDAPLSATNPYGRTKLFIEEILRDICIGDEEMSVALLRYFNPIGAHSSGLIGEDPNDIPNNLLPYVAKVANKELKKLNVFGNDYDTPDGTGVRDYIHVMDLAKGHLKALEFVINNKSIEAFNLGTGRGYSVLEIVSAFEKHSENPVPYEIVNRRKGDIGTCYADVGKSLNMLNWKANLDLETMCKDAWKFIITRKTDVNL